MLATNLTLKRTSRLNNGHLWIFSNEIAENLKTFTPGSIVNIYNRQGAFYGKGYINPHSLIAVRILTKQDEPINKDFFVKRFNSAYQFRKRFLKNLETFRLIYSEADYLPGLIVDVYEKVFVVQFLTLGMETFSEILLETINELFCPDTIVIRNDSPIRSIEGLSQNKYLYKSGSKELFHTIRDDNLFFEIDTLNGQKTGFFLDQRFNRKAFSSYIQEGSQGLDLFCYSGAWGIHALNKASMVTFVDSSQNALDITNRNLNLNNLQEKAKLINSDAFKFLKMIKDDDKRFDFIILDPPAFVKNKNAIKEALKGYREINSMAMSVLKGGGLLATSSCSHHLDKSAFIEIIQRSSRDANREIRILEFRGQSPDHPVLLSVPETEYLKCLFLEVN